MALKKILSLILCLTLVVCMSGISANCIAKPTASVSENGDVQTEEKPCEIPAQKVEYTADKLLTVDNFKPTEKSDAKEAISIKSAVVKDEVVATAESAKAAAYVSHSSLNEISSAIYDNAMNISDSLLDLDNNNVYPWCDFSALPYLTDGEPFVVTLEDMGLTKEDSKLILQDDGSGAYLSYSQEFYSAATEVLSERLASVIDSNLILLALISDNPYDLYWFDKQSGISIAYSYNITSDFSYLDGEYYADNVYIDITGENGDFKINIIMNVSRDYTSGAYYVLDDGTPGERIVYLFSKETYASKVLPAKAKADSIIEKYKNLSDYAKLKAYYDEIRDLTTYDYYAAAHSDEIPYGAPWQMINIFDNDESTKVVCEGYAKAFKYLCDNSVFTDPEIYCLTTTGYLAQNNGTGEEHMWNIVRYGEKNYLVDVTNGDSGNTYLLFMADPIAGSEDKAYIFDFVGSYLTYTYDDFQEQLFGKSKITLDAQYEYGDVNLDGYVNVSDCVKIMLTLNNPSALNTLQKFVADVNFDGKVDRSDADLIASFVGKIINCF